MKAINAIGVACMTAALAPCIAAEAPAEQRLPEVTVGETRSVAERNQLPVTTESITAKEISESVNMMNTEDAIKYLPDVLVRKRHIGDTQAPMTTRTSGVGASARSLIFTDGVLLSPLIANNNNIGGPRWNMVAPEEISRIDVMYGPFSAAYPGNSIGSVVEITTRMPEKFEATAKLQSSSQHFSQYATNDTYNATQAAALLGNRNDQFSWWLGANHLVSNNQPLAYVTVARPAAPSGAGTAVSGAFADFNRTGSPIFVLGAGALEHQTQDNLKFKAAYDLTPALRATYTVGLFQNDTNANVQSYLRDGAGNAVYSGSVNIGGFNSNVAASAFAINQYKFREDHLMQSFALKSSTRGTWDFEAVAGDYSYNKSEKRSPTAALPGGLNGGAGTIEYLDGTGWSTLDLKAFWRPQGENGAHQASFGAHYDRYVLANPKYNTTEWLAGGPGALATDSRGKTATQALWMQDAWRFAPQWKATLGGRYERWNAFDGSNFSAAPALNVNQPGLSANKFSPKASLAWTPANEWLVTGSLAKAYRFPTVSELYQAITTGATITVPNPNLHPENALSGELAIERAASTGRIRFSLFQENLQDALISQSALLVPGSTTLFSFVQNIEKVRSRGAELVAQQNDVFIHGLELNGSITYVDSRIRQDAANPLAVGKRAPQIPDWRATLAATWRPNARLATTIAARYSGRQFAQIDNLDSYEHTFQGFESFLTIDARVRYQIDKRWSAAVGVDNLNNREYFLFHPFPQRTAFAELRYSH
ncbi:MAG: TonB-dependent receptor [Betaproteobacteria bacterium]|nr:TonB-dependent receptor [Betaproteobacteria bacterium]